MPVLSEEEELLKPSVGTRETEPVSDVLPAGCAFRGQCWKATDIWSMRPPIEALGANASVACYHPLRTETHWSPKVIVSR